MGLVSNLIMVNYTLPYCITFITYGSAECHVSHELLYDNGKPLRLLECLSNLYQ